MRARRRPFSAAGLTLRLSIAFLLVGGSVFMPPRHKRAGATTAPNIVFILTDDQRWDTLWAMPKVQSELIAHGINFTNSFVVNSLCCPSRTSILTGEYSHSTLVYDNVGPYGGFGAFHQDNNTVATWLQGAGYRTGLLGKYLNGYDTTYIPPGWDEWSAFKGQGDGGGAYYDYTLNTDGTLVHYGNTDADYSTDVLANQADSFIRNTPGEQPLFLYFSTKAPHSPWTPATKYRNAFKSMRPYRPPNYNEADVSDKPAWVQALPLLSTARQNQIDSSHKKQYRTLLSVDDAVDKIVTALTDTGRLSNTMIVLMGDNGWSLGEHRWNDKKVVWEESIRVPLVVRYDPVVTGPRTDSHLMTNIDLGPTFADLAGVSAAGAEGIDMMPLMADPNAPWRHDFLIEHLQNHTQRDFPSFCAVRDDSLQPEGYTYVVYGTGEEELYDLKTDFYELQNLAADPGHVTQRNALRTVAETLCGPPPPGFAFLYDALPPSTPTGLAAAPVSKTEVDLEWLPSTDNVAVTGYTIYRDGASLGNVDAGTTTFADTTASPGTTYSYTVDAFDGAANHSGLSTPAVATTEADTEPPTEPTNLAATAPSPVQVDLGWTASTDDVAVTGYTIYRDGSYLATVNGDTTTYVDGSVQPNTTYSYTADAFDGSGNYSIQSDPALITTPADISPPTKPTGLTATAPSSTEVDLSWIASTDDVGVTSYRIRRNGTFLATVDGSLATYMDTGVQPGTTYKYDVTAADGAGNLSPKSDPVTITTPTAGPRLPRYQ